MVKNHKKKSINQDILGVIVSFLALGLLFLFFHGDYAKAGRYLGFLLVWTVAGNLQVFVCEGVPKRFVFSASRIDVAKKKRLIYVFCILPIWSAFCALLFTNSLFLYTAEDFSYNGIDSFGLLIFGSIALIWFVISVVSGIRYVFNLNKITEMAISYIIDGEQYNEEGKSEKAINYFQRAINIFHLLSKDDSYELLDATSGISRAYMIQSKYDTALEYEEKALAICRQKGYHSLTPHHHYIIGLLYAEQGNSEMAITSIQNAIDIWLLKPSENENNIANSYNWIAHLSWIEDNYTKALDYYEHTLKIRKRLLDDSDLDLADSYYNTGYLNLILADYIRAKVLFQRCINLLEQYHPKDHHSIADAYDGVGEVYAEQDEIEEALKCFEKAYAMRCSFVRDHESDVSDSYAEIGYAYSKQNNHRKALEFYLKALDILEKNSVGAEYELAICYNNIASSYCSLGDSCKASQYLKKALDIQQEYTLNGCLISSGLSITAADICFLNNDLNQALDYHRVALEERTQQLGPEHPYTALVLFDIGKVFGQLGQFEKAIEYLQQARNIQEKCFNPHHSDLNRTIIELNRIS